MSSHTLSFPAAFSLYTLFTFCAQCGAAIASVVIRTHSHILIHTNVHAHTHTHTHTHTHHPGVTSDRAASKDRPQGTPTEYAARVRLTYVHGIKIIM